VLDVGLPGATGIEVLRDVRSARPELPVIMLTGYDDRQSRRKCLEAGATAFLAKPLVLADLRAEVERALGAAEPSA